MGFLKGNKFISWSKISILLISAVVIQKAFEVKQWEYKAIIVNDAISYYAYLPALFIYHDLTLKFMDTYKGDKEYIIWPTPTPSGGRSIKTAMGMSILYMPFFLIAHAFAYILHYNTGGYSVPYHYAIFWGALIYLIIGLYFLQKILNRYFSQLITSITLILIVLCTNLLRYVALDSAMSHVYSFTLFSCFIYLTIKTHERFGYRNLILTGLLLGLIALVRPSNIVIVLFFIFWNIHSFGDLKNRIMLFIRNYPKIILLVLSFILIWIPQLVYWKTVSGQWFFFSYTGERFYFNNPQILAGLFSYRNGWLIYCPIMVFSIIGITTLIKGRKEFFIPILVFLIVNTYVLLSWWCWWYTGYGHRAFIDSYALCAIPLASFITWTTKRELSYKIIIFLLVSASGLLGWFYYYQYQTGAIHYCMMTKDAYWESFFKKSPTMKYWSFLREPDYENADRGIQSYIDERNNNLHIICDNEKVSGNYLLSPSGNYLFQDTSSRSSDYAFSGKYSVKISSKNPYAMTFSFEVYNNEEYIISVRKFNNNFKGFLIVSDSENPKVFYQETNEVTFSDMNKIWGIMSIKFKIPIQMHRLKLKICVYNPSDEPAYFDDLEISKIN